MSSPLPPPRTGAATSGSPTSTQEIPVVPAAVVNTQHLPPPPAPETMRSTGPVEFVPEPPPPAQAAPSASSTASVARGSRLRVAWGGAGLAALGVLALELGLATHSGGGSWWSRIPLWSSFATVAAVLVLVAVGVMARRGRRAPAYAVRAAAAGVAGLVAFWLLVGLRVAATDRGFLLTAAVACLAGGLWFAPRTEAGRN